MNIRQKFNSKWLTINVDCESDETLSVDIVKKKTLLTERTYIKLELTDQKASSFVSFEFTPDQFKLLTGIMNEYLRNNISKRLGSSASKLEKEIVKFDNKFTVVKGS